MIAVIQRVAEASVEIESEIYTETGSGLLVFLGIKKDDSEINSKLLAKKIIDLRIFPDKDDKMNLNVRDKNGELLIISQFTLCTDNGKSGNRPSFSLAESPDRAKKLYEIFIDEMKSYYDPQKIKSGIFAAKMNVRLLNDGPVTIILEKK